MLPQINDWLKNYKDAKIAIMFGQEKTGLTQTELQYAHAILNIPTADEVPSINLAQAVVLCCYQLKQTPLKAPKQNKGRLPTQQEYQLLQRDIESLLDRLNFPPTLNAKIRAAKLRDIFTKTALNKENLFFIKGITKYLAKEL